LTYPTAKNCSGKISTLMVLHHPVHKSTKLRVNKNGILEV